MPRRNINAEERIDKKWSIEYINMLMLQLKNGVENPTTVTFESRKKGKK